MDEQPAGSIAKHGHHWKEREVTREDLENFRNNGLAAGFDGYSWVQDHSQGPEQKGVGFDYHCTISVVGQEFFRAAYPVGPGKPKAVEYDGLPLTTSDVKAVYNAWQVSRWCRPGHIVEIGLWSPGVHSQGHLFSCEDNPYRLTGPPSHPGVLSERDRLDG